VINSSRKNTKHKLIEDSEKEYTKKFKNNNLDIINKPTVEK